MNFQPFGAAVSQRFAQLSQHELFVVGNDATADNLWAHYLASFPEGTNPIYKTRTEHDCSCCRNFVKNLGRAVAIVDGKIETVWDLVQGTPDGIDRAYTTVADAMADFVRSRAITGVFRTKEASYGAEVTSQRLEDGSRIDWNHFHGKVAKRHLSTKPDADRGMIATTAQVFRRGLEELTADALEQVISLIEAKALYRGEEHLAAVQKFQAAHRLYHKQPNGEAQTIMIWAHAGDPATRFRNTVIGTLVDDLSKGEDLEKAVKSFEAKVAPTNYKRTTALITPRMIQDAMKTINELGLEPALQRRFARLSDVSVNNVLWVDNSVAPKMRGGLEGLLMEAAVKPQQEVDEKSAIQIGIDEFMQTVVPAAKGVEIYVRNAHQTNFMSLTTSADGVCYDALFKWTNPFAWSYNGNIADSDLRKAVAGRGGRVDGAFRFSHSWNHLKRNASLMDLHVFMPGSTIKPGNRVDDQYGAGRRVGWNQRQDRMSGGIQDVDYTTAAPAGYVPVENITFPDLAKMPEGQYVCKIHNWNWRAPTEGGFKAEIEFGGQVFAYDYDRPLKHKEWVAVATVTLRAGQFSIEHHIPSSTSSQDVWGVKTQQFVKVNTLMKSPNHWDGNQVGNKHWFFMLDGCKNPDPTRGIYNEFLNSSLEKHRKVFEVLGDKTKCPVTDDQLSGVGFSSTRGDEVLVRVTTAKKQQLFNVKF